MAALQVATIQGTTSSLDEATIEEFRNSLGGKLLCPGDGDYEAARKVWNGMIDRRPALIVRCSGVADVMDGVNFARTHHLLLAVRGGGHNVAGLGMCEGGLLLDLSGMRGVRVDLTQRAAWAQGGATWADLDRETQAFGLATTGGTVSDTGIGGLTLGGGLGWLMGKHGLACDNLISVDIVTADGQFRTASANENPDLYWAVRGGGGGQFWGSHLLSVPAPPGGDRAGGSLAILI